MNHEVRAKFKRRQYEFSKHAVDQSIIRDISVAEVEEAIAGRPLHVQCSYPSRPLVKIITLYEPAPDLWIDFRARR